MITVQLGPTQLAQFQACGLIAPVSQRVWRNLTKQDVLLTAICPICLGHYVLHDCQRCEGGKLNLGVVAIELLPIRDPYHPMPAGAPWLVVSPGGPCYLIDADGAARGANLALDPVPQPEEWAAQFTVVTQ